MNEIIVSIATQSDHSIILQILQEAQQWLWQKGINQWTLPFTDEWVTDCLERQEFYIATMDQVTVAIVRLVDTDPHIWEDSSKESLYIHSLAVQQGRQGKGLGRHLLDWVEQYAIQNSFRYLRLDCLADNEPLCQYYEKVGFVACGLKEIQNDHSVYKARLYEKILLPPLHINQNK